MRVGKGMALSEVAGALLRLALRVHPGLGRPVLVLFDDGPSHGLMQEWAKASNPRRGCQRDGEPLRFVVSRAAFDAATSIHELNLPEMVRAAIPFEDRLPYLLGEAYAPFPLPDGKERLAVADGLFAWLSEARA